MKKYPIAETFVSPQGEGEYTGTLMHFVRFAGCSVGRRMPEEKKVIWQEKRPDFAHRGASNPFGQYDGPLQMYTEECTLYDGRTFLCDTNFQTKKVMTADEILAEVPDGVRHICLTGGEPLDQPLQEFFEKVVETNLTVHIETSGTVDIRARAYPGFSNADSADFYNNGCGWIWIAVSPKYGAIPDMINLANEIKLLVDENFDLDKVPVEVFTHPLIYLQPVNDEHSVRRENIEKCLQIQRVNPTWRLSSQAHKLWEVR